MKQLRYSEKFVSIQGEGQFVGVPSLFVRTFGCNFRCMNFGLAKNAPTRKERQAKGDRYNPEVKELLDAGVHKTTKQFEDLPIVHTGCDTYASIYPEFKDFNKLEPIDELVEGLLELLPEKRWTQSNGQDIHLIMTGGEPLLGWQKLYTELFEHPKMADLKNVTFETNTTQHLHKDFKEYLENKAKFHTTFSCSPKLSVSGESWEDAIKPEIAYEYYNIPNSSLYLKFVCADMDDIEEAGLAVEQYRQAGVECPVYIMPLGGRSEEYNLNEQQVANYCLEKGWRFSPRLQISLFGNAWNT